MSEASVEEEVVMEADADASSLFDDPFGEGRKYAHAPGPWYVRGEGSVHGALECLRAEVPWPAAPLKPGSVLMPGVRSGDKRVLWVQGRINAMEVSQPVRVVSGEYDDKTMESVAAFQRTMKLSPVTGFVDAATVDALSE